MLTEPDLHEDMRRGWASVAAVVVTANSTQGIFVALLSAD